MTDSPLLSAALAYAKLGLAVLPLWPREKTPLGRLVPRGFYDATTDADTLRAWWAEFPTANVGVVPGPYALAVDVDVKHGAQGAATLEALAAKHGDPGQLDTDVVTMTPSGGQHRWLAKPATALVREGANALGPGIDVRSVGGYVVMPPSVTEGGEYAFDGAGLLDGVHPSPAPGWVLEALKADRQTTEPRRVVEFPARPARDLADWEVDELRSALGVLDPGMGRMTSTLPNGETVQTGWWHIGCALADTRGRQAFDLWDEWSQQAPLSYDAAEIRKQWADIIRRADGGGIKVGTLFWLAAQHGWTIPADIEDRKRVALGVQGPASVVPIIEISDDELEGALDRERAAERIPGNLLMPPGMLGELADHFHARMVTPQRSFAIGTAIQATACMMARRWKSRTGLRTNLYHLYLGKTACGKEGVKQLFHDFLREMGMRERHSPFHIASVPALIQLLNKTPELVIWMDEFGDKLRHAWAAERGGSTHRAGLLSFMKDVYGMSGQEVDGAAYAGVNVKDDKVDRYMMHYPCPQFFGLSTPDQLYPVLKSASVLDGFLNRFTPIYASSPKPMVVDTLYEGAIPDEVVEWARALATPAGVEGFDLVGINGAAPATMPEDEIVRYFLRSHKDEMLAKVNDSTDKMAPLWGRCTEIATKVAMVVAAGESPSGRHPCISLDAIEWGAQWAEYWIGRFIHEASDRVSDSEGEGRINDLVLQMKAKDPELRGLMYRDILNLPAAMSFAFNMRAFETLFETLVRSGRIANRATRREDGKGRPPKDGRGFFFWTRPKWGGEQDLAAPQQGEAE